jgi:peroxiredoxin
LDFDSLDRFCQLETQMTGSMQNSNDATNLSHALQTARVQTGETLEELSHRGGLLVVFLRHGGCPFCREALAEVSAARADIQQAGVQLALVHMMTDEQAADLFSKYDLQDAARFSDPELKLYQAFSLGTGSVLEVMGPKVWWRGFQAAVLAGHRPGRPLGNVLQLGGAFLVVDGKVARSHPSGTTFDRPNYLELATCELPTSNKQPE